MTKLDEIMRLAEEATPFHYDMKGNVLQRMSVMVDPDELKQMVELIRMQHEALEGMSYWAQPYAISEPQLCGFECKEGDKKFTKAKNALAAFEKFNGEG